MPFAVGTKITADFRPFLLTEERAEAFGVGHRLRPAFRPAGGSDTGPQAVRLPSRVLFTMGSGALFTMGSGALFTMGSGALFTMGSGALFTMDSGALFTYRTVSPRG